MYQYIPNFLKIKPLKTDTTKLSSIILIFIVFTLFDNIGLETYMIASYHNEAIIGVLLNILISYLMGSWILRYKNIYNDFHKKLKYTKIGILSTFTIFILMLASNLFNNLINILMHNVHSNTSQNQQNILSFFHQPSAFITIAIYTIILAPMIEEFLYRYLIIQPHKKTNNTFRLWLSGILFILLHVYTQIPQVINGNLPIYNFFGYCLQYGSISLILVFIYNQYRNYRLNITVHILWNCVAMLITIISIK